MDVQVEDGEGDDALGMALEIFRRGATDVALDKFVLGDVGDGVEGLLGGQDAGQDGLVAGADRVGSVGAAAADAVFVAQALEAFEGVEADDLAVAVEGLVNAAERGQDRYGLAPARPELDDDAVGVDNELVDVLEEKDAGEGLAGEKYPQVGEQFVLGQGRFP